ncbi:MAG: tol-pal system protein YbgF [Steroidobacteraceae bacterium]
MLRLLACSTLAAVLLAVAACATTPEEDPVLQGRLNDLDQRTTRIERVISNRSLIDLAQSINLLKEQVRELQGHVEELDNMNEALRKQQRALYGDLDHRLSQLAAGGSAASGSAGAAASGPPPGSEQAAYMQALDSIKSGKYPDAATRLQQFLATYPKSDLADNAEYWLGQTYYASGDFGKAADAYRTLLKQWPNSSKASDALLQLGYSQYELKQYADARTTLGQVVQRFPGSNAAQQAQDRLRQLSGGH